MRLPSGLALRVFGATALVVAAALGSALLLTKRQADRAADAGLARALGATQSAIEDALDGRSHTLARVAEGLARVPAYVSRVGEALRTNNRSDLLDQADEFRSQIGASWALITDARGALTAWTRDPSRSGDDLSEGALVGLALGGESTSGVWIEPGPTGDSLYQAVGVPILEPGGTTPQGVLVAALAIDSGFAAALKRQTASEIVFLAPDSAGHPRVLVTTLPRDGLQTAEGRLWTRDSTQRMVRASVGGEDWVGTTGPLRTAAGEAVGEFVGLRSRAAELAPFTALQRWLLIAFIGGVVLALLASLLVARHITRPVRQLAEATREVREGRFAAELPAASDDEIGELADAFRHMLGELREKQELVDYLSDPSSWTQRTAAPTASAHAPMLLRGAGTAPAPPAVAPPPAELAPGALLAGRWEIREVLGGGGMGVVYRALDRELQETVAVKTLRRELLRYDATVLERFKQEIRLARRITHRNVVRTHDIGEVEGMYFITMEYVEGTTLDRLIHARGRLPVPVALSVGKQICRALEAAHDEGVVHRDIKPQNIVVEPSGLLKVMDFGIARLAEVRPEGGLTAVGMVIGTPDYMAPEQLLGEAVDARADLYAAGAVLFECLTGRPAVTGRSLQAILAKHLEEPAPDPRAYVPDLPAALATALLRALAKDRDARWPTAVAFHEALDAVRA